VVRLVLGTGEFGWTETRLTAATLGVFSFSILFAALLPLVVRAFFAFQDTRTPALVTIISMILNIFLSFFFVFLMNEGMFLYGAFSSIFKLTSIDDIRVVGLVIALSITTALQLLVLLWFLGKKVQSLPFKEMGQSFAKILTATLVMALVTYLALRVVVFFIHLTTFWAVFLQASFAFILGTATYLAVLYLLDSSEIRAFWSSTFGRFSGSTKKI